MIVAIALGAGAITIVVLLRQSLFSNVDDSIRQRARDVVALAQPDPLPRALPVIGEERGLVQVIDRTGRVVAASANAADEAAIEPFRAEVGFTSPRTEARLPIGDGTRFRVVTLTSSIRGELLTVYVAGSLGPAEDTLGVVIAALAVSFPLLLALVVITTWVVVGRALRPVESIRARVAEISSSEPDQRVPEPDTDDEISRLARMMNAMLDRLEASMQHERRFVDDASHELRTPLTVVLANLELALKDDASVDWRTNVSEAQREALRMQALVADLLMLARAESATTAIGAVLPIDLGAVVETEIDERDQGAISLDTTGVRRALVIADQNSMRQMVRNLIENALLHARSQVTITVEEQDAQVVLTVIDDGPGIAPQDRERVFDRFVRLDDARNRDTGGTGLGLAICREILARHGGTIHVADTAEGASLVVRLPAWRP